MDKIKSCWLSQSPRVLPWRYLKKENLVKKNLETAPILYIFTKKNNKNILFLNSVFNLLFDKGWMGYQLYSSFLSTYIRLFITYTCMIFQILDTVYICSPGCHSDILNIFNLDNKNKCITILTQ